MPTKCAIECPVCGSNDTESFEYQEIIRVPFSSKEIELTLSKVSCKECKESGDFGGINDLIVNKAYKEIRFSERAEMLAHLKDFHITPAYMQRVLDIQFNKHWDQSRAGRLIRAFPWLFEVAVGGEK